MVKKKKNKIAPVVLYFNPVIGFNILFRGKDMYGNPASCLDKRMATGGGLSKYPIIGTRSLWKWMNTGITVYSSYTTIEKGYRK